MFHKVFKRRIMRNVFVALLPS